ncbi:MAG: right-handed parallel beta-helix repeat-containing protein [Gemmatimonadetes bacterium]|nr:right-handed parallel beta-helix repeat-containing protein [Gemmatimonadota bacterium]
MIRTGSRLLGLFVLVGAASCDREEFPGVAIVRMVDNSFSPAVVRVPVGSPVLFRNMGRIPHNAMAIEGSWGTDKITGRQEIPLGGWVEVRIDRPGVYRYYCSFHAAPDGSAGMVGTIVVGDVPYAPDSVRTGLPVVAEPTGVTRRVPTDYATIQGAVDAAAPGDLVLIEPGIYREGVTVTTPSLTIRGADRNTVILDGEFQRPNGIAVFADAVAVENLTVRAYALNGVIWSGVTGYRGAYLTALTNGDYGIFAYESTDGVIEHSYANGSPDSGFYIGGCQPCRAVVRNVLAERNALGYSGTNSGGDLYVIESVWRNNHGPGLDPNTFDIEPYPPQRGTVFMGNLVVDNRTNGFTILGGNDNLITRNRIERNGRAGVMIIGQQDRNYYPSTNNRIIGNVVRHSGQADLAMSGFGNVGNCFAGNDWRTARPAVLVTFLPCQGVRLPVYGEPASYFHQAAAIASFLNNPGDERYSDWWQKEPPPPPQPTMPGGASAPVVPPVNPFTPPDTARIAMPAPVGS